MRTLFIFCFLIFSVYGYAAEIQCSLQQNSSNNSKLIKVDAKSVLEACHLDSLFNINRFFNFNQFLNKAKHQMANGFCHFTAKDLWRANANSIGYRWPGDVIADTRKEVLGETKKTIKNIFINKHKPPSEKDKKYLKILYGY